MLSLEEAAKGLPVQVRGVVLLHDFVEPDLTTLFIHDGSAGIYIEHRGPNLGLISRQLVEVRGISIAGEFAPAIGEARITVVGESDPPTARLITDEDLLSGKEDAQWVEVGGIVRTLRPMGKRLEVDLMVGAKRLTAVIFDQVGWPADPALWVDSRVRVRGVCAPRFNHRRQVYDTLLNLPDASHIIVDEPAPLDPYAAPARPISQLLRFDPESKGGRRVKVRGIVTHQMPGSAVFLTDATQSLQVKTAQLEPFQRGDEVEALGFPSFGKYTPVLEDAVLRRTRTGSVPVALGITAEQALSGDYEAGLVSLEARLLERVPRGEEQVLVLREGNVEFNATLPAAGSALLRHFKDGSRLRLTGICLVERALRWRAEAGWRPESFQMLLRSATDIEILQEPPWWNLRVLLGALGITSVAALLTAAWGALLQKRVRSQTSVIRQNLERELILEERSRIARDLHDTLAQGFAGVGFQLEAVGSNLCAAPETARQHLELALAMVRHSLGEARRAVMDWRSPALEGSSLAEAISAAARQMLGNLPIQFEMKTEGEPTRLSEKQENHLLRIAQEALANLVKHSAASHATVSIAYGKERLCLKISDDGKGFDPSAVIASPDRHFGLTGMRDRVRLIRGSIEVRSAPGSGTELAIEVPISANEDPP